MPVKTIIPIKKIIQLSISYILFISKPLNIIIPGTMAIFKIFFQNKGIKIRFILRPFVWP